MFLDEIAQRLASQGVGVLGTNIFTSSSATIPEGDGPYLTIAETGGTGSSLTHGNTATERPTAQLTVRAKSYPSARNMLSAAYAALGGANGLYNVTLTGVFYLSIRARQVVTDMGKDADARALVVFNIDAEKQPS